MRWLYVIAAVLLLGAPLAHAQVDDPLRRTPLVRAVERVAPAVVTIGVERPVSDPFGLMRGRRVAEGEGSGVVIDASGIVLTNAHVVDGAQRIVATFADQRRVEATILGLEPSLDLAVLRLETDEPLVAVPIGTSSDLMLGEPAIALGNPMGLGHTVTTGVISATRRPLETERRVFQDFIQTDASINPGNSGGPLVNARGELIGINTAIRADAQNIGFAIPVDRAMKVASDLMTFGTVRIPWLGVDLGDVRIDHRGATAPRVERVWAGSHADRAGIRPGDVIVSVDGYAVQGRGDLNAHLASFEPGRRLRLGYLRGADRLEVVVQGGTLPAAVVDVVLADVLGVRLRDDRGVVVVEVAPGGAFARSGLRAGDRIAAVNGEPVRTVDDLRDALGRAKSGHRTGALFTVVRGSASGRLTLPI